MPFSPQDVLQLTNDDKELLERTELLIDKYLMENFTGDFFGTGGSIDIPVDNATKIKPKIKREICSHYTAAGWKQAEFTGDKFHLSTHEKSSSYYRD